MEVLGHRLIQLHRDDNSFAKELGEIIGVSDVAIINWENDVRDIKEGCIVKLTRYFGVISNYLLGL